MSQLFSGDSPERIEELLSFINCPHIDPKKTWITVHDCKLILSHCESERKRLSKELVDIISEGWDT
jgi:hypothetical protein